MYCWSLTVLFDAPQIPAGMALFLRNPQEWDRNPQEWNRIPQEWTDSSGMGQESSGMRLDSSGMGQELQEYNKTISLRSRGTYYFWKVLLLRSPWKLSYCIY